MGATCTDACRDNVCNDGYVGYGESCDPPGRGCEDNCILSSCGDGVVDGTIGEECDPPEPGVCSPTCEMAGCNDGIIDPNLGEQCEGNNLDDMTCMSLGYFAGDLQCDSQCHFVVSSCTNCGNGSVQAPEQCDGGVGTSTCVTLDFDFGNLLCSTTCAFDTSGCGNAVCGNDILEPTEACDTNQLNGNSCASMGYADTDDIECVACMLDFSGCTLCGNGVLDGAETCEMGMDIPDMCSEVPPFDNDSAVVCNFATCQLDVSMCCGDDHDDPCTEDEDCCGPTFDCGDNSTCCLEGGQPCGGNDGLCCSGDCLPSNNCMNE
jgi:hypothetical protein